VIRWLRRTGLATAMALAAGCAAAGCGLAGTPGGQPPASQPASQQPGPAGHTGPTPVSLASLLHPGAAKYVGVEAPGAPDSLSGVRAFAASLGRKPDLRGQYVAWGSSFDARAAARAWSYGALYYVAWEPYGTSLAAIAKGDSNGYVTAFARAISALHRPVAISFGHEMNGN
jgi:mannan endo-1,4-beta-mannosidase